MEESEEIRGWFGGRLPGEWFTEAPEVRVDREEILVIGRLAEPEVGEGGSAEAAREGRIRQFREDTRQARMKIAREAEHRFGRKVSWGARCGDTGLLFTHLSVPVMTRLRQPERQVLDTLVDAGVARSRSGALAWCVELVSKKQEEWLKDLREALEQVRTVREQGPGDRVEGTQVV